MKQRKLIKRNKELYEENCRLKAELAEEKEKSLKYDEELRKMHRITLNFVEESDKDWNEICKLKDKIYNMQADKDKCIEFIKKQRCMLSHSEDEIARVKDENSRLMQNIQALGVTFQENDQAYYKLVEANAFLAGKVQAYENASVPELDLEVVAAESAQ